MNPFARKSIDELQADARAEGEHSLKRELGPWNLVSLGVGAIIGTGIFVLTGTAAAQHAGPAIVLESNRPRPFHTPMVPLVPILRILVCGYMMFGLPGETWLRLVGWLALGLAIYFLYGRHHSVIQRTGRTVPVHEPPAPTYTEPKDEPTVGAL